MRVIDSYNINKNWVIVNCAKEQYLIVKEEINNSFFNDKEFNSNPILE